MNRLGETNSPYLLQHAENPVDWYPWGLDALEKAKREGKPIFLSIGYAACHWCHVMAHESFEDKDTAAIMNEHFVNIKVDREERPDIDNIYMTAVVAMLGQGGWPLSVFLTPDCKPFFGGTYFPPVRRFNLPSFKEILLSVARIWREDRQKILDSSHQITDLIQSATQPRLKTNEFNRNLLQSARLSLSQSYDWEHGGWGKAPKFPQPMAIEYLLRQASIGDKEALDICLHALDKMAMGGMYDVLGGGFSRYSTDQEWIIPHFEKMLYDNAQLCQVYLYAFLLNGENRYRVICEETIDFVLRELRNPHGGFYSSLDADSEGEEGAFYTWTSDEIKNILNDDGDFEFINLLYGISKEGNFEGKNILHRRLSAQSLADYHGISVVKVQERLTNIKDKLLTARSSRHRPATDDKVITSWNALMMLSLAEASRYLDREDYLVAARQNAEFLLKNMFQNGILFHTWRDGKSGDSAFLEDYAALALGLISLYQSDPNPHWFESAELLCTEIIAHFSHPEFGFYDTRDDHEELILRPRDLQDNALPSGNALAAHVLLVMAAFTSRGDLRSLAEEMLASMQEDVIRYPLGFAKWLSAFDIAINPLIEVAIVGESNNTDTIALSNVIRSEYQPHLVVAQAEYPPEIGSPPLIQNRPLIENRSTAYVCQDFVCQQPVHTPDELLLQLEKIKRTVQ